MGIQQKLARIGLALLATGGVVLGVSHMVRACGPPSDPSVVVTDSSDPVMPGETFSYLLTVHNAGPEDATNVVVRDTLPPEVTFVSATPAQVSGPNPLVWDLGTVPQGVTVDIAVVVTAKSDATGTFTNYVSLEAFCDWGSSNNEDFEDTTVMIPPAPISVTPISTPTPVLLAENPLLRVVKESDKSEVPPGDVVLYTILVENVGDGAATGVTLREEMPPDAEVLGVTITQGTVWIDGNVVTAEVGVLGSGYWSTVTITARVRGCGSQIENIAVAYCHERGDTWSNPVVVSVPCLLPPTGGKAQNSRAARALDFRTRLRYN